MGKLRTPEQVREEKVKATKEYLEHAEDVLSELLGKLFGRENERINGTEELNSVLVKGLGFRQLVMALRRYPRFDVACLSSMKPFEFVYRMGSEDRKVNVMVPTFGVQGLHEGNLATFELQNERNEFRVGATAIPFEFDIQRKNAELIRREMKDRGGNDWTFGRLTARVPKIPVDVQKRIDEARSCFDRMTIVWEAEWSNAPVVDPLIIGSVDEHHFLVDKYDVTKLERYISSEMTRSPLK